MVLYKIKNKISGNYYLGAADGKKIVSGTRGLLFDKIAATHIAFLLNFVSDPWVAVAAAEGKAKDIGTDL